MIRPAAISFRYCFPEVDGGGVAVVADGGVVDDILVGCGGGGCGGGGFGGGGGSGGGRVSVMEFVAMCLMPCALCLMPASLERR